MAICDLMDLATNPPPEVGKKLLARHPFDQHKKVFIIPSKVEELHNCVFDGVQTCPELTVDVARAHLQGTFPSVLSDGFARVSLRASCVCVHYARGVLTPHAPVGPLTRSASKPVLFFRKRLPYAEELSTVREDHLRVLNPTPYKVSVTEKLYEFMMELIDANAPLNVLS